MSQLKVGGITLAGYSVAGEESVILAPELDCAFDIGRCPAEALPINHVMLSHEHMDHSAGIVYYFAQRDFQGIGNGTALVPAHMIEPLEDLMTAWGRVEGHVPPHNFVPMRDGDDYEIHRTLIVRAFKTRHVRGSLGFSLIDVRKKLKDEFVGLSGPEIVEVKNKGIDVVRRVEVPLIAFLGDTAASNYAGIPHVAGAKVLLLECTFFEEDHVSRARAGKHLHVSDLPAVLEGMNNERIVIIHVTRRTNMSAARKLLKKTLPTDTLDRITFLMSLSHVHEE